jgi:tetratricopeptide (TPR) repeat protein
MNPHDSNLASVPDQDGCWWPAPRKGITLAFLLLASVIPACSFAQEQQSPKPGDWTTEVKKYVDAQNWMTALQLIDRKIARAPQDTDIRSWRARVLAWSGKLEEAEHEYFELVKLVPQDPDLWAGLGNVYLREGQTDEAVKALNQAVALDPRRADLRAARGRALRAQGARREARLEFQRSLELDPGNSEGHAGLLSLVDKPKHELRFGENNDLFNFADANHDESVSLVSHWTSSWTTNEGGNFYQRDPTNAEKFVGSVTRKIPLLGSLTAGGAVGRDNGVIPKSEAFFEYDRGSRVSEEGWVRGLEFVYGQHWFWYRSARILALNETAILYLPRDWTWSVTLTEARSHFSGLGAGWKPSGSTRLGFPLANWGVQNLSGNVVYAVGSEDFARVDQIGSFASQSYGGGLRYQFTARQDVGVYGVYQRRTQGRTETSYGLSYAIHF